jgi:rhodanese-related sulfurtransferase
MMKNRRQRRGFRSIRQAIGQGIFLVCISAMLAAGFNALRPGRLAWKAEWSPASLAASQRQGLEEITLDEAWSLYQTGRAQFLDARDPVSFYEGHIKRALSIPPGEVETHLQEVMDQAKSGRVIIAYCDGVDCPLSTELARSLQKYGVASVKVLVDGWGRWRKAGYPREKGER